MGQTALTTGASSGIGEALAHQFAKNGYDVIIIAEDATKLTNVAKNLRDEYDVNIREISSNLLNENAPDDIYNQIREWASKLMYG